MEGKTKHSQSASGVSSLQSFAAAVRVFQTRTPSKLLKQVCASAPTRFGHQSGTGLLPSGLDSLNSSPDAQVTMDTHLTLRRIQHGCHKQHKQPGFACGSEIHQPYFSFEMKHVKMRKSKLHLRYQIKEESCFRECACGPVHANKSVNVPSVDLKRRALTAQSETRRSRGAVCSCSHLLRILRDEAPSDVWWSNSVRADPRFVQDKTGWCGRRF